MSMLCLFSISFVCPNRIVMTTSRFVRSFAADRSRRQTMAFSSMAQFMTSLAFRLYGYLAMHLCGIWLLVVQLARLCNGRPAKHFNFVRQERKVFIVTGGMDGVGRKTVERLMNLGAFVIITGRRPSNSPELAQSFESLATISSCFLYVQLELERMTDTVGFCTMVKDKFERLDGLVCNAGTLGGSYRLTDEGLEAQQAVNYLSCVIMLNHLRPMLKATQGRVVLVTSAVQCVAYCNLDDFMFSKAHSSCLGYVQSKCAQIALARHAGPTLLRRDGIAVNAVHPGIVNTALYSSLLIRMMGKFLFISPSTAAETVLFALLSPSLEGVSGMYMEDCNIVAPAKKLRDPDFIRRLHELTCRLLAPWLVSSDDDIAVTGGPDSATSVHTSS